MRSVSSLTAALDQVAREVDRITLVAARSPVTAMGPTVIDETRDGFRMRWVAIGAEGIVSVFVPYEDVAFDVEAGMRRAYRAGIAVMRDIYGGVGCERIADYYRPDGVR